MEQSAAASEALDPLNRASYSSWRSEVIRYNDLDTLGHVTSQAFINFCESARVLFLRDAGQPIDGAERGWMLARMEIDFHAQLRFPGAVDVGTAVLRLGNASLTTVQGLFDGGRCAATLISVLVLVDRTSDRAAPLPAALRARLSAAPARGLER